MQYCFATFHKMMTTTTVLLLLTVVYSNVVYCQQATLKSINENHTANATGDKFDENPFGNDTNETPNSSVETGQTKSPCSSVKTENAPLMIPANETANHFFPVRVGTWTWTKCQVSDGGWLCNLERHKHFQNSSHRVSDVLRMTVWRDGWLQLDDDERQCVPTVRESSDCRPGRGGQRNCLSVQIKCPNRDWAQVQERNEKNSNWTMFGYGVVGGFLIGCLVAFAATVCIETSEFQLNDKKVQNI